MDGIMSTVFTRSSRPSSLDICDVNAALARQGRPPDGRLQGFTVSLWATKIRHSYLYFEMYLRLEDIPRAAQGRQEVGVCECVRILVDLS